MARPKVPCSKNSSKQDSSRFPKRLRPGRKWALVFFPLHLLVTIHFLHSSARTSRRAFSASARERAVRCFPTPRTGSGSSPGRGSRSDSWWTRGRGTRDRPLDPWATHRREPTRHSRFRPRCRRYARVECYISLARIPAVVQPSACETCVTFKTRITTWVTRHRPASLGRVVREFVSSPPAVPKVPNIRHDSTHRHLRRTPRGSDFGNTGPSRRSSTAFEHASHRNRVLAAQRTAHHPDRARKAPAPGADAKARFRKRVPNETNACWRVPSAVAPFFWLFGVSFFVKKCIAVTATDNPPSLHRNPLSRFFPTTAVHPVHLTTTPRRGTGGITKAVPGANTAGGATTGALNRRRATTAVRVLTLSNLPRPVSISHPPHTASAIAHTRTRRDYSL